MTPIKARLKAVRDRASLKTMHDVQSFLGPVNYYKRFIQDFVAIVDPLKSLKIKEMVWKWGPNQQPTFRQLKDSLCVALVLLFLDPKLPYIVVTDAFGTATSGVLMQDQAIGLQLSRFP